MKPSIHLMQSAATTAVLYPVIEENAFIVGASVIAIDVDHFFVYYYDTGKFDVKGMLKYHDMLSKNLDGFLDLSIFHTMECYLTLFVLGHYHPSAIYVLIGFLFHHLFDLIPQIFITKRPFVRALSIFEFLYRKKNHFTTLSEIMQAKSQA